MSQIKLISFDFWDTLFRGNLEFHRKRNEFLSNEFKLDFAFVARKVKETKQWCDLMGEKSLMCIPPEIQLYHLGKGLCINNFDTNRIREKFFEFLKTYPPICLVPDNIVNFLSKEYLEVCVSCNTGFFGEDELNWIISNSPLKSTFTIRIFSDSHRYFKPNPLWFSHLPFHANEILHIGDNNSTDGQLCINIGAKYLKVEPQHPDFSEIFNLI